MAVVSLVNAETSRTGLSMIARSDFASIAVENVGHVYRSARSRLHRTRFQPGDYLVNLRSRQMDKYDAIYAYGRYPKVSHRRPVVWHDGPSDLALLRKRGWSEKELDEFAMIKLEAMSSCVRCLVSSEHAARIFSDQYPTLASKIVVAPFLLPHVEALRLDQALSKHREWPVRLLFVGRQAFRKGLDVVLSALQLLQRVSAGEYRLDVVSAFEDGWRPQGDPAGVQYHGALPKAATMSLMRQAHFLVMPSRVESYGIVYIEAMSQGAIPVAVDREPQRSMLGEGRYGILTPLDAEELAARLQKTVADEAARVAMVQAALRRFESDFSVGSVLRRYEDAFAAAG